MPFSYLLVDMFKDYKLLWSLIYSTLTELHNEIGDPQKRLELLQTGLDEALSQLR